jgi:hypothetical protein
MPFDFIASILEGKQVVRNPTEACNVFPHRFPPEKVNVQNLECGEPDCANRLHSSGLVSFTWNAIPGDLVAGNGVSVESDSITVTTKARIYRVTLQF